MKFVHIICTHQHVQMYRSSCFIGRDMKWQCGLSITGVPSRKSNPDAKGEFELIVRPYKEILEFEPIPGAVKQRGGTTEQFSGVVTYKKKVYATDDTPELIHVEDG